MLLLCVPVARAAIVTFEWSAPDPADASIIGYALWEKLPGGGATKLAEIAGATLTGTATITVAGEHTIYATSYTALGIHSDPSNEVTVTIPKAPANLKIRVVVTASSDDGLTWTQVAQNETTVPK